MDNESGIIAQCETLKQCAEDRACAIECEIDNARIKALESLGKYKFMMFGYWAAIWVHLNRLWPVMGGRKNPFAELVKTARRMARADGAGGEDAK